MVAERMSYSRSSAPSFIGGQAVSRAVVGPGRFGVGFEPVEQDGGGQGVGVAERGAAVDEQPDPGGRRWRRRRLGGEA